MKTKLAASAAAFAMLLALAGCGSTNDTSSKTATTKAPSTTEMDMGHGDTSADSLPADVSDADVTFVQGMIPHHQQAVEMAQAVIDRGSNAEVKSLAEGISSAQDPEIKTMQGWLSDWGQSEMNMGMMDGMMTDDEMKSLDAASGAELDKMFVEMMIRHHEGAVTMAEQEVASGKNADTIDLAKKIITAQKAEITKMNELLPRLG